MRSSAISYSIASGRSSWHPDLPSGGRPSLTKCENVQSFEFASLALWPGLVTALLKAR